MSGPARLGAILSRAFFLLAGLAVVGTGLAAQGRAPAAAPAADPDHPKVNAQGAAQAEFQARLDRYLTLRSSLAGKLKPLSPTPDAADLASRQELLAAAIKKARATAKRGDLIPPLVAQLIATTVREDFQRRNPTAKVGVFEEVPERSGASLINRTFPAADALATVPPLLLRNLPMLPDNLQYRFSGSDVVILDGDVQVIIDYVPRVLPAH
jgi:hypothetical protein